MLRRHIESRCDINNPRHMNMKTRNVDAKHQNVESTPGEREHGLIAPQFGLSPENWNMEVPQDGSLQAMVNDRNNRLIARTTTDTDCTPQPGREVLNLPDSLESIDELLTNLEVRVTAYPYDLDDEVAKTALIWRCLKRRRYGETRGLRERLMRVTYKLYTDHELSLEVLQRRCGFSPAYISRWFKALGLKARDCTERTPDAREPYRVYVVAPDALDDRNDPDVAYLIGFLWADGRVLLRKDGTPEGLRIVLNPKDAALLRTIRRMLGSNAPIRTVTSQLSNGRRHEGVSLTVYSHRLASALADLGFTKRNRGIGNVPPPAVPAAVEPHFWRGLCDGDGHIRRDKRYNFPLSGWELGICGPDALVQAFQDFVKRKLRMRASAVRNGRSEVNYRGYVTGVRAPILAETLYPEGCLALQRPYSAARSLSMARRAALELGMRETYQGSRLVYTNTSAAEPTVREILYSPS